MAELIHLEIPMRSEFYENSQVMLYGIIPSLH